MREQDWPILPARVANQNAGFALSYPLVPCTQTLFLFVLFPHHYPLALAVNKSPAVYILSPASLDGL